MGWHSDRIGLGSNQWLWFRHGDRRGCCHKFNSNDHHDESSHCGWLGTSHRDIISCCIDSNIWRHDINGNWFHCPDHEL